MTDVAIDLPWGRIDAGTVAVRRIVIEAVCRFDHTAVEYELVWRVSDVAAPQWPSGRAHYAVTIDGRPDADVSRRHRQRDRSGHLDCDGDGSPSTRFPQCVTATPGIKTRLELG